MYYTEGIFLQITYGILRGMKNKAFQAVCQFFGSQRKTAAALGVTPGAVNHVVSGRKRLPIAWCPRIEEATERKFLCEELRPDVKWSVLRTSFPGQKEA